MTNTIVLNPSKIEEYPKCLAVVRLLAAKIQKHQYLSLKEIIEDIADADIESLLIDYFASKLPEQITLFALLLSTAEGNELTDEGLPALLEAVVDVLVISKLSRVGFAKVNLTGASILEHDKITYSLTEEGKKYRDETIEMYRKKDEL